MGSTSFIFNPYPIRYRAQYDPTIQQWNETFQTLPYQDREHELSNKEKTELQRKRNYGNDFPLVTYSSQYALSCFEGIKAYPNINGGLSLFRPHENAKRFYNSMKGLFMPPFPPDMFTKAIHRLIKDSRTMGFYPVFQDSWKDDQFATARGIYVRPFSYSEGGFGLSISKEPYVIIVATEVGNYVDILDCPTLMVSDRIRATENGTGWIKCASNYVTSILAREEAKNKGFHEALFLDANHRTYIEECSSCNVFFVLKNKTIVTPSLGDTILPGITRDSIIILAKDAGYVVEERRISIEEVMDNASECFSTGTAVGISHFGTITYKDKTVQFSDGRIGEVSSFLQKSIKMIQHGLIEDKYGWLDPI